MLYFSLFLAGFIVGIFAAIKIFSPEKKEEVWDPQNFPVSGSSVTWETTIPQVGAEKPAFVKPKLLQPV